jgi:hypothetical protein
LVILFCRASFCMDEDVVVLALMSSIGGYFGEPKISLFKYWVLSSTVSSKSVSFHTFFT